MQTIYSDDNISMAGGVDRNVYIPTGVYKVPLSLNNDQAYCARNFAQLNVLSDIVEVADYESQLEIQKFKMPDRIRRTNIF